KALLNAPGQLKLQVDLLIRRLQAFIDALHLGRPGSERIVAFLDAQEGPHLGNELGWVKWPQQISIGAAFQTGQTGSGGSVGGHIENGDKALARTGAQALTQLERVFGEPAALN